MNNNNYNDDNCSESFEGSDIEDFNENKIFLEEENIESNNEECEEEEICCDFFGRDDDDCDYNNDRAAQGGKGLGKSAPKNKKEYAFKPMNE